MLGLINTFSHGWWLWARWGICYARLAVVANATDHSDCRRWEVGGSGRVGIIHHLHLSSIDHNRVLWLSANVGQNISQGQPAAQSRVLSIFCIPSKHHWYSTGKLCPQHMEAKNPQFNYTIPLSSGILTYPHTLKMSWIMINLFHRKCLRTVEATICCVATYVCCICHGLPFRNRRTAAVANDDRVLALALALSGWMDFSSPARGLDCAYLPSGQLFDLNIYC